MRRRVIGPLVAGVLLLLSACSSSSGSGNVGASSSDTATPTATSTALNGQVCIQQLADNQLANLQGFVAANGNAVDEAIEDNDVQDVCVIEEVQPGGDYEEHFYLPEDGNPNYRLYAFLTANNVMMAAYGLPDGLNYAQALALQQLIDVLDDGVSYRVYSCDSHSKCTRSPQKAKKVAFVQYGRAPRASMASHPVDPRYVHRTLPARVNSTPAPTTQKATAKPTTTAPPKKPITTATTTARTPSPSKSTTRR